jgi:hypothetical protein
LLENYFEPVGIGGVPSISTWITQTTGVSFLSHTISNDPQQFNDSFGVLEWGASTTKEYSSLMKNHTWDLIHLLRGLKIVHYKWVYRTKYVADIFVDKNKVCLVAKGFSHVEGIDYSETFAPIAKMNYEALVLSLVASQGCSFHQMDVKSTFLHGDLDEQVYMEQPPSFLQYSSLVCKLRYSLYGLKQSPQSRYEKMDISLISSRFNYCHFDPTIYT